LQNLACKTDGKILKVSESAAKKHQPVMLDEVLDGLNCHDRQEEGVPGKIYVDCTLGLGGHTEAILKTSAPKDRIIGLDRDGLALQMATERLTSFKNRLTLHQGAFADLKKIMTALDIETVDGILFDFGISSYQLDTAERGFSFQEAGPLDMRMDSGSGETAADLINRLSERDLKRLIKTLGEERWASRIASRIVNTRTETGPITRTEELENIIWRATPAKARHGRIHPATRTFQALRMAVNHEPEQIEAGLEAAISLLACGGRLVVISFHSLEDRAVKHCFRDWEKATKYKSEHQYINLHKKPIIASTEEIARNRRARSAKLRVLERAA